MDYSDLRHSFGNGLYEAGNRYLLFSSQRLLSYSLDSVILHDSTIPFRSEEAAIGRMGRSKMGKEQPELFGLLRPQYFYAEIWAYVLNLFFIHPPYLCSLSTVSLTPTQLATSLKSNEYSEVVQTLGPTSQTNQSLVSLLTMNPDTSLTKQEINPCL